MKSPHSLRWTAFAAVAVGFVVAGCKLDTSTPSGWQTPGPRSSATLPPDAGSAAPPAASVAEE
jgi:hypothetical protein